MEALREASKGGRVGWFAPTHKQSLEGWRGMVKLAVQIPGVRVKESEREIHFPGGGFIEARTADDPDRLRGGGWDLVVLDECRDINPDAWPDVIQPAIMDRGGRGLFLSTPRGSDWFKELFDRGVSDDPDWASWQLPTHDNPFVPREELDRLRASMSDRMYRQEILAEFIPDGGGVFRFVGERSTGSPFDPDWGVYFYDPARSVDYNAVVGFTNRLPVLDEPRERVPASVVQCYADRWHDTEWGVSLTRLSRIPGRGVLYVDTSVRDYENIITDPIQDYLGGRIEVRPFRFDQRNKEQMTESFAYMLEQNQVQLLDARKCSDVMRPAVQAQYSELCEWRAKKLPSGNIRYEGRDHDDMAIACITAAHLAREATGGDRARDAFEALGGIF